MTDKTIEPAEKSAKHQEQTRIVKAAIADWKLRCEGQGLKRGSVKRQRAELEFFMGVQSALVATGHPGIEMMLVLISVGRTAEDFFKS